MAAAGGRVVEVRASGEMNRVNEHAAGIDIGGERHYVAVPPGSTKHPVREFGVFTKDLYAIADWLKECGVETVAMAQDWSLLGAIVRSAGRAWFQGEAGRRSKSKERQRAEVRRTRLPMVAAVGELRVVTGGVSSEERERERVVANLKKRAKSLGFELVAKAA